ncbi:MAG: polysaccharide pyruvyl transferase family protein [Pseudomonadota bacterium]
MSSKIGVLTFHRCVNYGSYWQARCLVEGLRSGGHDAVLLDHASDRVRHAELACALSPLAPEPTPASDRPQYVAKVRAFRRAVDVLPRSAPFALERPEEMAAYDLVLVGSDEVWNLRHPWYGGCRLFFGAQVPATRLVSYAASFGNYDAAGGLDGSWGAMLTRFESLSVRDDNSFRLVRNAAGREPDLTLDPCLQFPPNAQTAARGDPYLLVYGHGFSAGLAAAVRAFARACRLTVVSVGYRNAFADAQHIAAGPEEFRQLMAGARAVVTNFFHGCVFALLNRKPFVCVPSPYRFNKVRDLAALLGAQGHLAGEELAVRLSEPPAESIYRRIAELRQQSGAYLGRALG